MSVGVLIVVVDTSVVCLGVVELRLLNNVVAVLETIESAVEVSEDTAEADCV